MCILRASCDVPPLKLCQSASPASQYYYLYRVSASFAQLRDEEAALKAELKSRCVVCGISRNEFDRGGNVFYEHVTEDHCM